MNSSFAQDHTPGAVINVGSEARATFISRTYTHLAGAIVAFTGLEVALFKTGMAEGLMQAMGGAWWVFFAGYMLISWFATRFAHTSQSRGVQYAALAAYVAAIGVIFVPILYIAANYVPGAITHAAVITLGGTAALTAIVFITRKDFSFLRTALLWGGIAAAAMIVLSMFGVMNLGIGFSFGMVALMCLSILYDTSNILHHYPEDRYVGAALQLFASVAILFFYVLRILIQLQSRD